MTCPAMFSSGAGIGMTRTITDIQLLIIHSGQNKEFLKLPGAVPGKVPNTSAGPTPVIVRSLTFLLTRLGLEW